MLDKLRFPARAAAFVGVTLGYYGAYAVRWRIEPEAGRPALLEVWKQHYAHNMLRIYGVHMVTCGAELSEGRALPGTDERGLGRIFVLNHRSALDILITVAKLEAAHVSRADLARWPVIGIAAKRIGTLFVDRESRMSAVAVLQAMRRAVEGGRGIIVFPEGTTYDGDEVRKFHAGAFSIAKRTGAEIVPVGVAYGAGGASFGDETFLQHMRRVSAATGTRIAMIAGEPIRPEGQSHDELAQKSRAAVQALVNEARQLVDSEPS